MPLELDGQRQTRHQKETSAVLLTRFERFCSQLFLFKNPFALPVFLLAKGNFIGGINVFRVTSAPNKQAFWACFGKAWYQAGGGPSGLVGLVGCALMPNVV
jgi:hypothetical protein